MQSTVVFSYNGMFLVIVTMKQTKPAAAMYAVLMMRLLFVQIVDSTVLFGENVNCNTFFKT